MLKAMTLIYPDAPDIWGRRTNVLAPTSGSVGCIPKHLKIYLSPPCNIYAAGYSMLKLQTLKEVIV